LLFNVTNSKFKTHENPQKRQLISNFIIPAAFLKCAGIGSWVFKSNFLIGPEHLVHHTPVWRLYTGTRLAPGQEEKRVPPFHTEVKQPYLYDSGLSLT